MLHFAGEGSGVISGTRRQPRLFTAFLGNRLGLGPRVALDLHGFRPRLLADPFGTAFDLVCHTSTSFPGAGCHRAKNRATQYGWSGMQKGATGAANY